MGWPEAQRWFHIVPSTILAPFVGKAIVSDCGLYYIFPLLLVRLVPRISLTFAIH